MEPITLQPVQEKLDNWQNKDVYIHLETTNGAYSEQKVGAYIRNSVIRYHQARIVGDHGQFRAGLKTENGWIYAEGLTDWTFDNKERLLLAGHDAEGRLAVALQLSEQPF